MTFITTWAVAVFSFLSVLCASVTFVDINQESGFNIIYAAGERE